MFVFLGSMLAGIIMVLRELIPLLAAHSSGRIRARGHGKKIVLRTEEPERFKALCRNRVNAMGIGFLAMGFGVLWAFFHIFALIPALIVGGVMAANARKPRRPSAADAFD